MSREIDTLPVESASPLTPCPIYLVRIGSLSQVGRFAVAEALQLSRHQRVVCRTARGIEVGQVLGVASLRGPESSPTESSPTGASLPRGQTEANQTEANQTDGRILRRLTAEDELLWGHLQQLGKETFEQCSQWLEANHVPATLLDVEPLLDGQTLYFHFLTEVEPVSYTHLTLPTIQL